MIFYILMQQSFVKNHHIMSKLSTKSNHGFLLGSFVLMIMLFLIVLL